MKVKREDWEALQARLARLESELRDVRSGPLMTCKTGPVLVSVVVPMILEHLNVEVVHGYSWLIDKSAEGKTAAKGNEQ